MTALNSVACHSPSLLLRSYGVRTVTANQCTISRIGLLHWPSPAVAVGAAGMPTTGTELPTPLSAFDSGTKALKLLHQILMRPVEVVEIADFGAAFGDEAGQH